MSNKSVVIIGAGASGLVSAKVLVDDGFDVVIFERNNCLGGTWSEKMAYLHLHTQQPGGTMEFAELFDGTGNRFMKPVINEFSKIIFLEYGSWDHTNTYINQ